MGFIEHPELEGWLQACSDICGSMSVDEDTCGPYGEWVNFPIRYYCRLATSYPFHLSSRDGTSERRDTVFLRSPFTSGPSGCLMPTA